MEPEPVAKPFGVRTPVVTRLLPDGRAPWFCAPASRRVCLCTRAPALFRFTRDLSDAPIGTFSGSEGSRTSAESSRSRPPGCWPPEAGPDPLMAARRLIIVLLVLFAFSIAAAMIAPDRRGGLIGGSSIEQRVDDDDHEHDEAPRRPLPPRASRPRGDPRSGSTPRGQGPRDRQRGRRRPARARRRQRARPRDRDPCLRSHRGRCRGCRRQLQPAAPRIGAAGDPRRRQRRAARPPRRPRAGKRNGTTGSAGRQSS